MAVSWLAVAENGLLHLVLDLIIATAIFLLAKEQMLADGQCFSGLRVPCHLERQHIPVKLRLYDMQVSSVLLVDHIVDIFGLGGQRHDLDVVIV